MFALDREHGFRRGHASVKSGLAVVLLVVAVSGVHASDKAGLGTPATEEQIAGWDIDIRPDGTGLPAGQGDALTGEEIYIDKCAACHGEFGEGVGNYPVLAGGEDSLDTEEPVKTVGSYWPYASTVFDYIRRAMPFGHAQSLTADETYAITAYVLNSSDVIESEFVLNQDTLANVEMPNAAGFIKDSRPDVPAGEPCMENCRTTAPTITGRARQIDVTPEDETEPEESKVASSAADPVAGEKAFAACAACHSVIANENKFGPSLHGVVNRKAGTAQGFTNYSAAIKSSDVAWTAESLASYIESPSKFLPGTSMPFGGIKDGKVVGDIIAYLKKVSDAE